MDGKILIHVRFRALCIQVWFGIVHNLAIIMLLRTSLIERFIRDLFVS